MKHFQSGTHGNYIYGYIFFSGRHHGLVIDEGSKEFPIDSAEVWDGRKFVYTENLNSLLYSNIGGSKARIKINKDIQSPPRETGTCKLNKTEGSVVLGLSVIALVGVAIWANKKKVSLEEDKCLWIG